MTPAEHQLALREGWEPIHATAERIIRRAAACGVGEEAAG